jgi:transposase
MSILKRVMPDGGESVHNISRETGVSESSIYKWIQLSKSGNVISDSDDKSPRFFSAKEKYHLLMTSAKLSDDQLGAFLREHGLHSEHLTLWDQEIRDVMTDKASRKDTEKARLKKENQQLKKELARKDKALAETTALLVLKKKLDALITDPEDD